MNNDLISRSELYAAIGKRIAERHGYYSLRDIKDAINNAPSVEPFERIGAICNENCGYKPQVQGKWIYTDKEDKEKGYGGYCSVCKCDMPIGMNDWKQEYYESNFCPNCGARMVSSENK